MAAAAIAVTTSFLSMFIAYGFSPTVVSMFFDHLDAAGAPAASCSLSDDLVYCSRLPERV
jgi:hypothetical protein